MYLTIIVSNFTWEKLGIYDARTFNDFIVGLDYPYGSSTLISEKDFDFVMLL